MSLWRRGPTDAPPADAEAAYAALVEAHFAGRITPEEERRLRAHLPGCERCRGLYDRHLLFASLDPKSRPAEKRLARGLGIGAGPLGQRLRVGRYGVAVAAGAALAGVAAMVVVRLPDRVGDGYTARGGAAADEPAFEVYRVRGGAGVALKNGAAIARTDELAFAYGNPGNAQHLVIFGVDEHQHVYWYHPAWTDPETEPAAVPIAQGPLLRELPEAIAHNFDGVRLRLFAIFSTRPLTVRQVEELLPADADARTALPIPETKQKTIILRLEGAS